MTPNAEEINYINRCSDVCKYIYFVALCEGKTIYLLHGGRGQVLHQQLGGTAMAITDP